MFSLIITIVSIALVVALVAATMYHGGDTLTQGRTTADAAAFVAGAQQIGGAQVMHISLESVAATTVANGAEGTDLVLDKYLASAPVVKGAKDAVWGLDNTNKVVTHVVASTEVCEQINKTAGAATPASVTSIDGLPYGCITEGAKFQFKF